MAGQTITVARHDVLPKSFPETLTYTVPVPEAYGNSTPIKVRQHFAMRNQRP